MKNGPLHLVICGRCQEFKAWKKDNPEVCARYVGDKWDVWGTSRVSVRVVLIGTWRERRDLVEYVLQYLGDKETQMDVLSQMLMESEQ